MMPERKYAPPSTPGSKTVAAQTAAPTAPAVESVQTAPPGHRLVFVYGTLRAGGSNDIRRYRPPPQWIGRAVVAGTLYDFGGWPGLRLTGDACVVGEVWRIDPRVEPLLDRLEGVCDDGSGEYLKRSVSLVAGGRRVECMIYEINMAWVRGRPAIPGGDWIVHCAERASAPGADE